jgi:hypothetical protein
VLEVSYKAVVLEAAAEHVAQAVTHRVVDAVDLVCVCRKMGDRAQNAEYIHAEYIHVILPLSVLCEQPLVMRTAVHVEDGGTPVVVIA